MGEGQKNNETTQFGVPPIRDTLENALAKYWYDTEYVHLDKKDHRICEESRLKFRKWLDENLDLFDK